MPKINWRVRIKSRQFWLGVIGAIGTFVVTIANVIGFGDSVTPWVETLECAVTSALTVLSLIGVVTDPTTTGMRDSLQVLQYKKQK